jgi:hypothetical protein
MDRVRWVKFAVAQGQAARRDYWRKIANATKASEVDGSRAVPTSVIATPTTRLR